MTRPSSPVVAPLARAVVDRTRPTLPARCALRRVERAPRAPVHRDRRRTRPWYPTRHTAAVRCACREGTGPCYNRARAPGHTTVACRLVGPALARARLAALAAASGADPGVLRDVVLVCARS